MNTPAKRKQAIIDKTHDILSVISSMNMEYEGSFKDQMETKVDVSYASILIAVHEITGIICPECETTPLDIVLAQLINPNANHGEFIKIFEIYAKEEKENAKSASGDPKKRLDFLKEVYKWIYGSLEGFPVEESNKFNILPGLPCGNLI